MSYCGRVRFRPLDIVCSHACAPFGSVASSTPRVRVQPQRRLVALATRIHEQSGPGGKRRRKLSSWRTVACFPSQFSRQRNCLKRRDAALARPDGRVGSSLRELPGLRARIRSRLLAACRTSDGASWPNADRVTGRLGLGQEALPKGNGSCGARSGNASSHHRDGTEDN